MSQLALESFDTDGAATPGPDPAYQAGFVDGEAAGLRAAAEQQSVLQAELAQTIADLSFTFTEAKQEITQSLRPLFDQIIQTLLPHCVDAGFGAEIASLLHGRLQDELDIGLTLTVHPEQAGPVADALAGLAAAPKLAIDGTLSPHAAWVSHGGETLYLDLDTLCAEVSTILSAIHTGTEGIKTNG